LNQREENLKIWNFQGKFSNPEPNPKMADLARPGSKIFDPKPSLLFWAPKVGCNRIYIKVKVKGFLHLYAYFQDFQNF